MATLTSLTQGAVPSKVYSKVLVVVVGLGVKVPATASNKPPVPVPVLVQTPPVCSPLISVDKLMRAPSVLQIVTPPSVPALGCALIFTVTILKSSTHGATPAILYSKVQTAEAPTAGKKVPAAALKVPPVPNILVHVPPACAPVINNPKSIGVRRLSQTVVEPSRPALGCAFTTIVVAIEQLSDVPVSSVTLKV